MIRRLMMASSSPLPPSGYDSLNPADASNKIALSGGNLVATATAASAGIVRGKTKITGKVYFESVFTAMSGSSGATVGAGIASGVHDLYFSLGYTTPYGWAYWGKNVGARHNGATAISESSTAGHVLGFAIDRPNNSMWIRSNGTWMQGDPAAGTSPIWTDLSGDIYAAAGPWAKDAVVTMRFDPASFDFAAPSGFSAIEA